MGNTDSIPVISQAKSLVQAIAGDTDGARETQENFIRGCPVISQGVSLGAAIAGETEYARETQRYFVQGVSDFADTIPVVGHAKGGIHYLCGDTEGGDNAMKASSRTVGVKIGAIGGFFVGGPVGAVVGGIGGGAALDGIITGVGSAVEGEYRPYGHVAFVGNSMDGNVRVGDVFDWTYGIVADGKYGWGYAKAKQTAAAYVKANGTNQIQSITLEDILRNEVENNEIKLTEVKNIHVLSVVLTDAVKVLDNARQMAGSLGMVVIQVEGNEHVGFSYNLTEAPGMESLQGEMSSSQQKIITVQYSSEANAFVARLCCGKCQNVGIYIKMDNVVMDGIHLPFEGYIGVASAILSSETMHCCSDGTN